MEHTELTHFSLEHGRSIFLRNFGTHLQWAPVFIGNIQFRSEPTYGLLAETTWQHEIWAVHHHLWKCTVQRAVVELQKHIPNLT